MQVAAFIFIERRWERDQDHLQLMLAHLCDIRQPLQLLIFPEGTDLTATTKARSDEFAEARGLPKYQYILHPRTTGFAFIVNQLRKGSSVDAIHDVTVAYPYNIPQSERDLFTGKFPKEIHFHIRRYSAAQLPVTLEGLQEWCRLRWHEKERLLHNFYQGDRSFHGLDQVQYRSPDRALDQSPEQVQDGSTDRGLDQEQDRSLKQIQDRSPDPGLDMSSEQVQDRSLNQGLDQEQDRSPEQGLDRIPDQGLEQDRSPERELGPRAAQERGEIRRRRWGQAWGRRLGRPRMWFEGRGRVWLGRNRGQDHGRSRDWRSGLPQALVPPCKSRGRVFLIKLFSMVYWTAFVLGTIGLLWSYTLVRWYFSTVAIFFILQERLFGGIEMMEMAAHRRAQRRSKKH
ncbi:lysocardiolipin acyltransferase 1 isoform X2 [Pristis pectinata]|nr:lysocardiolipin acyltransferase 1 isoform X2 [Pristis pectinata]